jgi:D-alanyl-D-alanine carboxypeptidase
MLAGETRRLSDTPRRFTSAAAALASLIGVVALTACASAGPVGAPADGTNPLAATIDSIAMSAVEAGDVVGLSVGVLRGDDPIRIRGYGVADVEHGVAATEATRYYVGSITKTVTAAAILRLAEEGRLDLDDDVTEHIEELDSPGLPVTIRHLLQHTSGLAGPQQVLSRFVDRRHLEFSRSDLVELLQGAPRVAAPGERMAYNNLGYLLLGIVVERRSGQSFDAFLRDHLLADVDAPSLMLCHGRPVIENRASGYVISDGTVLNQEPVNASLLFTAGGICATAGDVARWFQALGRAEAISAESLRRMTTPGRLVTGTPLPYGHGMVIDTFADHPRYQHGGDANGFSSQASYYPDQELTIVVLTNTRAPAARRIEAAIARLLLGTPGTGDS